MVPIAFGHTNGLDVQASEHVTPTLRAGHGVGGGSVSFIDTARYDTSHAETCETHAREALRAVRETDGEEAAAEWLAGIAAALRSAEVLRSNLHGPGLRREAESVERLEHDSPPRPEAGTAGCLRTVPIAGSDGRASLGRRSHQQRPDESRQALPVVSHEDSPCAWTMLGLRSAAEGSRVLLQALSAVEATWRPASHQDEPAHPSHDESDLRGGLGVNAVRRLTPV